MGNGEALVLNNVLYCSDFSDNVLTATHIAATTNWTPTPRGMISPTGACFLLIDFQQETHAGGIIYDTRQQTRVRCMNVTTGVSAGPALDRVHGRHPSSPVDLGMLPILPSKLPACVVHAAALADIRLSEVTSYLSRLTYENTARRSSPSGSNSRPRPAARKTRWTRSY